MSDLIINIRIGLYHFQLSKKWKFSISRNDKHKGYKNGIFQIYEFSVFKYLISIFREWNKWSNGFTGFYDSEGKEIWVDDFVETFDRNGQRWTAFIKRKKYKIGPKSKKKYCDIFASNWNVMLNSECSKDFRIIQNYKNKIID